MPDMPTTKGKRRHIKATPTSTPAVKLIITTSSNPLIQPKQTYLREAKRLITAAGCKRRSNSTVMVETMLTASPEFMAALPPRDQREFFTRAVDFMASKVGRDNILSAVVHMDERTPHMHLCFCPITEGKSGKSLSAKVILGNST